MNKFLAVALTLLIGAGCTAQKKNGWTIMHYAVGSNSSEIDLLNDVAEMKRGKIAEGYEVILLIDRTAGFSNDSTTLGEDFNDTRLYRITNNGYEELNGGDILPDINPSSRFDANMADAGVLKEFIRFSKKNYPANHYMLVLRSHGNGVGMCPDPEAGEMDRLYPGEIRDQLTAEESVDILGLDVCSMAGLENLYEWRPDAARFSANYIIASAPLSAAWAYDQIFGRLREEAGQAEDDTNYFSSGKEAYLNPYTMSPLEFSTMIMEEIYDNQRWASWGLFDNSKIVAAKNAIDQLAKALVNEDKESIIKIINQAIGYHHNTNDNEELALLTFPYVDAYDFFLRISDTESLGTETRKLAKAVCGSIDELVVQSYYGRGYLPETDSFEEGKSGGYLILPVGNRIYSGSKASFWAHTNWFHPEDKKEIGNAYGLYDWCTDDAVSNNKIVENFYEYMDYLFEVDGKDVNGYDW